MKQIIITVGYPGSGKSEFAEQYLLKGYQRLNRDTLGGTLKTVAEILSDYLEKGSEKLLTASLSFRTSPSRKVTMLET